MPELSIIIPSYNTKDTTLQCLESLQKSLGDFPAEIIVVDNASEDGSPEALKTLKIKTLLLEENIGYSKANNRGLKLSEGRYILYLNSDVLIDNVDFAALIKYLDENPQIGALTVKVSLPTGGIDPASHRGFPTLWRSFTYFSGLEKTLGKLPVLSKIFGGYHLLDKNLNKIHEIDSPTGAFFLTRKELMDKLGGFDEAFFMYGEDIDLAFRIKELGYKIVYYPLFQVTHLKYKSGLSSKKKKVQTNIKNHFYEAMKIFYDKHYARLYPSFLNNLVYMVIDFKAKRHEKNRN